MMFKLGCPTMHEKLGMIGRTISKERIITKPCASFLQSPCVSFTIFLQVLTWAYYFSNEDI